MAWRRKRKAAEKSPPRKQRKGKAPADEVHSEAGGSKQDEGIGAASASTGFFGCYLLASINPKRKGATYIGFTVNPVRRLRQHNGDLTAGAWKTKRMRPVEMVLTVYGFPSMVAALQFEWAWQHPTVSLAVKEAAAAIKNRGGVKGKIALLYAMLNLPKWRKLPLVVHFVTSRHVIHKLRCPPLPEHMDCILAPLSQLRVKVDEAAEEPPICDEPSESASAPPEPVPQESASTEAAGNESFLDRSESGETPASPRGSPAKGGAAHPSTSCWADPLDDWDWLDRSDTNIDQESERLSWTPKEADEPFLTWQVRKGLREHPGPTGKAQAAESLEMAGGESAAAPADLFLDGDRVGKSKANGDCSAETESGMVAVQRRGQRAQDVSGGADGGLKDTARAAAPPLSRPSHGNTSCGAAAEGRTESRKLPAAEILEFDTINLSSCVDDYGARPFTVKSGGRHTESREKRNKQGEQRPGVRPGVELVILEDSPTSDKPEKPSTRGQSTTSTRSNFLPASAQQVRALDASQSGAERTGKGGSQLSRRRKNHWSSRCGTIIDLDP